MIWLLMISNLPIHVDVSIVSRYCCTTFGISYAMESSYMYVFLVVGSMEGYELMIEMQ